MQSAALLPPGYGDGDGVILCEQTFKYTTGRGLDETLQMLIMLITLITSHCNYISICTLVYCVIIFSNYTHRFSINYTGRILITNKARSEIIYVNFTIKKPRM